MQVLSVVRSGATVLLWFKSGSSRPDASAVGRA
jgi:hypothetical protein